MKNKVVVWGTNAENEKILIALELRASDNKVVLYTFPEAIATDDFVNKMMNEWRNGKKVDFPEGHTTLDRELSVTENLLPDELKVERGDVIQRAQTEWHFAVLSAKLHAAYQQELAEFKEKVEALTSYDHKIWDNLKTFWDKVQNQSRERNLFRQHADDLRDNINALFEELKKIRSRVNSEFMSASSGVYEEFNKALDDIEARIVAGGHKLSSVFEDLKQMQRRYRDARLSNEHRNQLWDRLDGAFKKAKARKFGPATNDGSLVERHERRLEGLVEAIKRMGENVRRDEDELNFQRKKVNTSEGQLEAQIRMAKIKMIEERLISKREKLAEMEQTRAEVERQSNSAKDKEARRMEKEAEKQKIETAKEAIKSEIAAEIKAKAKTEPATPAEKAGEFFEAASTVLGDVLMDALDTARAVATVAAEKADGIIDDVVHKAAEKVEDVLESLKKEDKAEDAGDNKPIIDDMVHNTPVGEMESFASTEGEPAKGKKSAIIIDDVVHSTPVGDLESFSGSTTEGEPAKGDKSSIIIDDVVHRAADVLEKASGIIDDIVHKGAEQVEKVLESLKKEEPTPPVIEKTEGEPIIDDVVHKAAGEVESETAAATEEAKPAKSKPSKKADA